MVLCVCRRYDLVLRCDVCSFCFMLRRKLIGITIRCLRKIISFCMISSFFMLKWGVICDGIWLRCFGYSYRMMFLRIRNVLLFLVVCWIFWSFEVDIGRNVVVLMCSNLVLVGWAVVSRYVLERVSVRCRFSLCSYCIS